MLNYSVAELRDYKKTTETLASISWLSYFCKYPFLDDYK